MSSISFDPLLIDLLPPDDMAGSKIRFLRANARKGRPALPAHRETNFIC
jgi:hypothetical protein